MEKYLAKNWFCCGFIGLFAVLLWGQSVHDGFVWDDEIYIANNQSIRSLANVPKIFLQQTAQSAETAPTSYRPVRNIIYALLYAIDGHATARPWIFHLANVLANALAAILVFLVADLLWQRLGSPPEARIAALLISLGFASQPVTSEVVCWAKCLDDILAAIFVLASARALLKWTGGRAGYVAALGWFLVAVFSKDSAVPFASVVFLLLFGFHKFSWQRSILLTLPFFAIALFYVAYQLHVMGHLSQCPPLSGSYGQTLIDMFPVAQQYLRLLWGIPPFLVDYNFMLSEPRYPIFASRVLTGEFLVLLFSALAAVMWWRPNWRITSFGLLWVALFLLPVSNLVPMMQFMAERFLYLPLIGFLIALGGVALNLPSLRRPVMLAGMAVVLIWTATSLNRMTVWRDELTLFVSTEIEHPGIKRVETNGLVAIFRLPQIEAWKTAKTLSPDQSAQMISTLEKARKIYPESDILTTQIGMTYARMGRWPEAAGYLELATRQNPISPERWYDLGSIYRLAGLPTKAKEACAHALQLNPNYKEALTLRTKLDHEVK